MSNIYRTRDERWMQITAVLEDKLWPALCRAIGRPSLEADPRFATTAPRRANAEALTGLLDDVFQTRDWTDWHAILLAHAIPHAPVQRVLDLPSDVQAEACGAVVPAAVPGMPRTLAAPFQIQGVPPRTPEPGPALGADTDRILAAAGYTGDEIAALRACGAVA